MAEAEAARPGVSRQGGVEVGGVGLPWPRPWTRGGVGAEEAADAAEPAAAGASRAGDLQAHALCLVRQVYLML